MSARTTTETNERCRELALRALSATQPLSEKAAREGIYALLASAGVFYGVVSDITAASGPTSESQLIDRRQIIEDLAVDALGKCIMSPEKFSLGQIAGGVMATSWCRSFLVGSSMWLKQDALRIEKKRATPMSPEDAGDFTERIMWMKPPASVDELETQGMFEDAIEEWVDSAMRTSTPTKPYRRALVLAQGFNLKPLRTPAFGDVQARLDFVEWMNANGGTPMIRSALASLAHSGTTERDHRDMLVAMTAQHTPDELMDLAEADDLVLDAFIEAATTPRIAPALRDRRMLGRVIAAAAEARASDAQRLATAWVTYIADRPNSKTPVPVRTHEQAELDRQAFIQAADAFMQRYPHSMFTSADQIDAWCEQTLAHITRYEHANRKAGRSG